MSRRLETAAIAAAYAGLIGLVFLGLVDYAGGIPELLDGIRRTATLLTTGRNE